MARGRVLWIVLHVALAHAGVLVLIVTSKLPSPLTRQTPALRVEIIEIFPESKPEPKPPAVEPATIERADPAHEIVRPPTKRAIPENTPLPGPPDVPPVLTKVPSGPAPDAVIATSDAPSLEHIERAQLADVLTRLQCQKLQRPEPDKCPKPAPFVTAAAPVKAIGAHLGDTSKQRADPQTQLSQLYMMSSMQSDLFVDGFAPGAYNAQRIRNGQSPIWDKSIEEQLRQRD